MGSRSVWTVPSVSTCAMVIGEFTRDKALVQVSNLFFSQESICWHVQCLQLLQVTVEITQGSSMREKAALMHWGSWFGCYTNSTQPLSQLHLKRELGGQELTPYSTVLCFVFFF